MKVHLLENTIQTFLAAQIRGDITDWYYPHALVHRFHTHWQNVTQENLSEIYDTCLRSEISQRWWKREQYRPKEIMLQLMEADPELAYIAWKDLQQPNAGLEGRLSRFTYYCEQLLTIHKHLHFKSIETYHHQDAPMLSLYLAGLFPDKYTLYPGLDVFQRFCQAIGSPDIPRVDDLVRYMKVVAIIDKYIEKSELYPAVLESRRQPQHKTPCLPFQITFEVVGHAADTFKVTQP